MLLNNCGGIVSTINLARWMAERRKASRFSARPSARSSSLQKAGVDRWEIQGSRWGGEAMAGFLIAVRPAYATGAKADGAKSHPSNELLTSL